MFIKDSFALFDYRRFTSGYISGIVGGKMKEARNRSPG